MVFFKEEEEEEENVIFNKRGEKHWKALSQAIAKTIF